MKEVVIVLAVIAVIAFVIIRQLRGEPLRGKRVVLLPAVLLVIGAVGLNGNADFKPVDGVLIGLSALVALAAGLGMGAVTHLESRDGGLWGRLPHRGLWLWGSLIASRLVVEVVASSMGAKVASSEDSILLVLGVNRLAQAAVIVARAVRAGIPFAPEKNGQPFMPGLFGQAATPSSAPSAHRTADPTAYRAPASSTTWMAPPAASQAARPFTAQPQTRHDARRAARRDRSRGLDTRLNDVARRLNDRFGEGR